LIGLGASMLFLHTYLIEGAANTNFSHCRYISTLVAKFTIEGLEIARVGSIAALRLTGAGLRGAAIAGGVVSGLLIPIDIVDIAYNATKLFKKSDSKATEQLSKHISDLEEQRDKILNALPPLE